jgi:hypothetical protein
MPDYVHNLLNKVVNADPANATYQGQGLEFFPTGLWAGAPGWMLTDLTDKWFLGGDRPALPTDLTYSGGQPLPLHYAYAAGSLFGSGAGFNDVMQGYAGDCYLMAGLEEATIQAPQYVNNMVIDNGDGTYTVRFYNNGTPDYVTVDRYLPSSPSGKFEFANMGRSLSDPNNKLWVALAEKAYAQLDESGWNGRGAGKQVNSYRSLDNGSSGLAMSQITGHAATSGSLYGMTGTTFENDFLAGRLITFNTSADPNHYVDGNVVRNHVYALVGFFSNAGGIFVLDNPWAPGAVDPSDGKPRADTLALTVDQMIAEGFVGWAEVNLHPLPYTQVVSVSTGLTLTAQGLAATGGSAAADPGPAGSYGPPGPLAQEQTITHVFAVTDLVSAGSAVEVHPTALYFQRLGKKADDPDGSA